MPNSVFSSNNGAPATVASRRRSTWPLVGVAVIFVVVTFLTWHGTWFGRGLSDAEINTYLSDGTNARHVQHALWQLGERMIQGDKAVERWYPRMIELSTSPLTELRQVDAMVMGQDNSYAPFQVALKALLSDHEPIVRRNAALALIRFGDHAGHDEILSILKPSDIYATRSGQVTSTLSSGLAIKMGALLARIRGDDGAVSEVRAPLPGRVGNVYLAEGAHVDAGAALMSLSPDPDSVWEALRGLYLVGEKDDLRVIQPYAEGMAGMPVRVQDQARRTVAKLSGINSDVRAKP
jgi:hypothetical protein